MLLSTTSVSVHSTCSLVHGLDFFFPKSNDTVYNVQMWNRLELQYEVGRLWTELLKPDVYIWYVLLTLLPQQGFVDFKVILKSSK